MLPLATLPTPLLNTPTAKPTYGTMSEVEARGLQPDTYICEDKNPSIRLKVSHVEGETVHFKAYGFVNHAPVDISSVKQVILCIP
jgi:hypothetical protein